MNSPLPDRLLACADALHNAMRYVRDERTFAMLQGVENGIRDEAAAALFGREAVAGEAPKPDWRYWYERTLWWIAKAKEFGYDPDNGVFHPAGATTPQPGDGWQEVGRNNFPETQRMVLLHCAGGSHLGSVFYGYFGITGDRPTAPPDFYVMHAGARYYPAREAGSEVTHWMPLPAAPSAKGVA